MSTDSSPPNVADDVNGAAFENSAHPPIHLLNVALTPEEFGLVFRANQAEVAVYQIVFDAQKPNDDFGDSPRKHTHAVSKTGGPTAASRRSIPGTWRGA